MPALVELRTKQIDITAESEALTHKRYKLEVGSKFSGGARSAFGRPMFPADVPPISDFDWQVQQLQEMESRWEAVGMQQADLDQKIGALAKEIVASWQEDLYGFLFVGLNWGHDKAADTADRNALVEPVSGSIRCVIQREPLPDAIDRVFSTDRDLIYDNRGIDESFATAWALAQRQFSDFVRTQKARRSAPRTVFERFLVQPTVTNWLDEARRHSSLLSRDRELAMKRAAMPTPIPGSLPQHTFEEVRALQAALADGSRGAFWGELEGQWVLAHQRPRFGHSCRIDGTMLAKYQVVEPGSESLQTWLKQLDPDCILALQIVLGMALAGPGSCALWLADLVEALGWDSRSHEESDEGRRHVWDILTTLSAMSVHGCRSGTYRDPVTKEQLRVECSEPLIALDDPPGSPQPADADGIPYMVRMSLGPWLSNLRGNHTVLPYFGDVRRVACISPKTKAGSWAKSIGIALNQLWREGATKLKPDPQLSIDQRSVAPGPFTPRQLLGLFPRDPYLDHVLRGRNPARAEDLWNTAMDLLAEKAVIASPRKGARMQDIKLVGKEAWAKQPVDIRMSAEGAESIASIRARRDEAVRRPSRRRKEKPVSGL